jgi:beta-lactam-binding protein with PASTA domain
MPGITRYFTVIVSQGTSTIKLDSKGCATCQITVKNVSRAAIDGRAILVSLPITRPPAGVVEKNWVKIDGPTDRHFTVDQEEVFPIKIAVPQKKGEAASAGNYSFRLDLVNIARPDESSDQSQALGFTVAEAAPPKPSRWPLIAAVAAVVLIVAGLATWLLTRGNPVPDLSGKTTDEAFAILAKAKFILDQNIDHVDSGAENSGLIVAQNPSAGKRAGAGSMVKITLGAPMVIMPKLTGLSLAQAQDTATKNALGVLTTTNLWHAGRPEPGAAGIVWEQTPTPDINVRTGTPVSVKVNPKDVQVVDVRRQNLQAAYSLLITGGLTVGHVQGDPGMPVLIQDPAPGGPPVPVGTPVNLTFECRRGGWLGQCMMVYQPAVAHQMIVDRMQVAVRSVQPKN